MNAEEQRSLAEAKRRLRVSLALFDRLVAAWDKMTTDEQLEYLDRAEQLVEGREE